MNNTENLTGKLTIRKADVCDIPQLLQLIKELAEYEKLLDSVTATEDSIRESMCSKLIDVYFCEADNKTIGYAITFYNFSSFTGKKGLYLEDLYIQPDYRSKGYGKAFLSFIAKTAVENNCQRFEWTCLDWNKPSQEFYKSLGAVPKNEWIIFRTEGEALRKMSEKFKSV